jgi:uncharacterized membrane protein
MFVFALLLALFAVTHVLRFAGARRWSSPADRLGWALGATLLVTGSTHFAAPEPYLAMMPPWLPWHRALVYLSGVAELVIGVGLCTRAWRGIAALAAIALFVAILPANVYAAASGVEIPNYPASPVYRWARLPMQALLIGWAFWVWRRSAVQEAARALRHADHVER